MFPSTSLSVSNYNGFHTTREMAPGPTIHIFEFLKEADLATCSCVCRLFKEIIQLYIWPQSRPVIKYWAERRDIGKQIQKISAFILRHNPQISKEGSSRECFQQIEQHRRDGALKEVVGGHFDKLESGLDAKTDEEVEQLIVARLFMNLPGTDPLLKAAIQKNIPLALVDALIQSMRSEKQKPLALLLDKLTAYYPRTFCTSATQQQLIALKLDEKVIPRLVIRYRAYELAINPSAIPAGPSLTSSQSSLTTSSSSMTPSSRSLPLNIINLRLCGWQEIVKGSYSFEQDIVIPIFEQVTSPEMVYILLCLLKNLVGKTIDLQALEPLINQKYSEPDKLITIKALIAEYNTSLD